MCVFTCVHKWTNSAQGIGLQPCSVCGPGQKTLWCRSSDAARCVPATPLVSSPSFVAAEQSDSLSARCLITLPPPPPSAGCSWQSHKVWLPPGLLMPGFSPPSAHWQLVGILLLWNTIQNTLTFLYFSQTWLFPSHHSPRAFCHQPREASVMNSHELQQNVAEKHICSKLNLSYQSRTNSLNLKQWVTVWHLVQVQCENASEGTKIKIKSKK